MTNVIPIGIGYSGVCTGGDIDEGIVNGNRLLWEGNTNG